MAKALLLALLLPVAQEEPQVTYREGLFEEVDQGNLEKAVELYAKVLKGGAPDALKAKALLRTGACHEKKGKKKEAEQAWRDVIARYPAAEEAVKLARERLARPEGDSSSRTQDDQIQRSILALGSHENLTQEEARRTLTLLGDAALPHLRRALQHRDRTLSSNAARILCEMGLYEGLYDCLRRFWLPQGDPTPHDAEVLPRILKDSEANRKRFLKDVEGLRNTIQASLLAPLLCSLPEPEFPRIVEDWIVERDGENNHLIYTWAQGRTPADILRLMKRLAAHTPLRTWRILHLFHYHAPKGKEPDAALKKEPDPALKAETLTALKNETDSNFYFPYLHSLVPHFGASALIRGPVAEWFARGSRSNKNDLLQMIESEARQVGANRLALAAEGRKYLFEQMAAADVPLATKELILAWDFWPRTREEQGMNLAFCLEYWKKYGAQRKEKQNELKRVHQMLHVALPTDSKELPAVLDASFEFAAVDQFGSGERRKLEMAAALRYLAKDAEYSQYTMRLIEKHGSTEEKLALGGVLGTLGATPLAGQAASIYAQAFSALLEPERDGHWKDVRARFDAGTPIVKSAIAQGLSGIEYGPVDDLMKALLTSPNVDNRHYAIMHWGGRNTPDALGHLISALNDSVVDLQVRALELLQSRPSLEAVPGIIKLLHSPSKEIRDAATSALNEIKKHFEAQAEWQRWYDEIKKTLKK